MRGGHAASVSTVCRGISLAAAPFAPAGPDQQHKQQHKQQHCMLRIAAGRCSSQTIRMSAFAPLSRTTMQGMSTDAAAAEPELLMAAMGGLRVVDLNRPKALNALNISMIRELYPFLVDWNRMGGDVNVRRHAHGMRFATSTSRICATRPCPYRLGRRI